MSYERLSVLARAEEAAVRAGDWETLEKILDERDALISFLPAVPPPEALPHLEAAGRQAERTERWLERALDDTAHALGRLRVGRRVLTTYAGGGGVAVLDRIA